MYYVYKHTAPNGKVYIGVTSRNPSLRWRNGNGYKENEFFTKAIKEYGWNNIKHEVIFTFENKETAGKKEQELIKFYKSNDFIYGYNIEMGGFTNFSHSDYTKRKISKSLTGVLNPRYGKKFPNQTRCYNYDKSKRSLSHKGQVPVNKIVIEQYDSSGNFLNEFPSMSDASKFTGISVTNICRVAKGVRKTAGNYIWKIKKIV